MGNDEESLRSSPREREEGRLSLSPTSRLGSNTLTDVPNLEITLGRQSWQMEYAESSNELTLLKCL